MYKRGTKNSVADDMNCYRTCYKTSTGCHDGSVQCTLHIYVKYKDRFEYYSTLYTYTRHCNYNDTLQT
jgi:hypothetical protein